MEPQEIPYLISAPIELAFAAAFAAHRVNEGYRPVTQEHSNKVLMVHFMREEPNLITDEDRDLASQAREWYKGMLFDLLAGTLNEYMQRATEVAIKETIHMRNDVGILSSLPNTWMRSVHKQNVNDVINESTGGHVGAVTEKITRKIEVLDSKQGVSFTGWLITATDGTHIYRFCASVDFPRGEIADIQGKVKKHDFDRETNKPVTWLNYVKKLHCYK